MIMANERELMHYGVKGMRWGVIHERPLSGTSRKKSDPGNAVRYGSAKSIAVTSILNVLSFATGIPIGTIVSSTASLRAHHKSARERTTELLAQATTLKRKEKETSLSQDEKRVNPKFTGLAGAFTNNCTNCVTAYELRRRGYDVTAKGLYGGRRTDETDKIFGYPDKVKVLIFDKDTKRGIVNQTGRMARDALLRDLNSEPKGSRGVVEIGFRNGGMGHVFNWAKDGDAVRLVDCQNYGSKPERLFSAVDPNRVSYYRTDNANINMDYVYDAVSNRK